MEMFGKGKDNMPEDLRSPAPVQQFHSTAVAAPSSGPESANGVSSISAGMTVVGKLTGSGAVKIFGSVEGELHAATVLIADGAEVEGDVVAEELTVAGRVKGTIRANRVRLNSTASVEADIFHRSLAIEENARFEGTSRRDDNAVDKPPFARSQASAHALGGDSGRKLNGAPDKETQTTPAAG
jgi:cytoskeletal protein CcmA (bactofilin family)